MEPRITAQSQSFKLRERLEEAKVSHGQEVRDLGFLQQIGRAHV